MDAASKVAVRATQQGELLTTAALASKATVSLSGTGETEALPRRPSVSVGDGVTMVTVSPRATVRRGIIDVFHLHATGRFLSSLTLRRHATDSMLRSLEGESERASEENLPVRPSMRRGVRCCQLPFTYLVHRFFSVEQKARRKRAHRRERTTPSPTPASGPE